MVSKKANPSSAEGSFLGYLFQIERIIIWLSELDENASVGAEVADDIVIKLGKGEKVSEIYEQAKHTIGSEAPYTNKSIDLWKTLSIWVKAVEDGSIDPKISKFSLLSNLPLPANRFAHKLSKANFGDKTNLDTCCDDLLKIAGKLSKEVKPYGDIVSKCPIEKLKQIISNIEILDPTYKHSKDEYLKKLRSELHIPDDMPIEHISEKLFGFVSSHLMESWRDNKEAWITVKVFNKQCAQLVAEYSVKPFYEKTTESLPITKVEIEKNRGSTYVAQLKLIDCSEDEILESIHEFMRALSERDRYAKDGEISPEKMEQYLDDLKQNWITISKPRFKFCTNDQYVRVGYEVLFETLKYKGKLNNYEPEQHYTYKGAYHHLANELSLGWHPTWKDLLK